MTISLPYLKKWQINIENSDNSLEILKNISFQLYWLFVILHSYSTYSVISYLFCPLYLCVKPQATPLLSEILLHVSNTHMWWKYVAEEDLDLECFHWNPFVPMKRVHTHSATSVQVNSAILYIHNTQYSTQYMNERYQITTSFKKRDHTGSESDKAVP